MSMNYFKAIPVDYRFRRFLGGSRLKSPILHFPELSG